MASNTPKPKKTTTKAAPEKEQAKPKSAPKLPDAVAGKPEKSATKPAAKKPATQTTISAALIAQRAYYIAEERQRTGAAGDSTQDWLNAEKQLKAEQKPKKVTAKK